MYLYPMYFGDELIEQIARSTKIIPYLDLPLQHINDTMLKRMQRRVDRRSTEELLAKLRSRIEGLTLRTTFITGLSGRDRGAVRGASRVRRSRSDFERMGVFTYSLEPDTPAARLPDHLPEDVKEARRERLMQVQQRIAFEWNAAQVGRQMDVLIDQAVPGEKDAWIGRSAADAPDVDGVVYVSGRKLRPGRIVKCEIVATSEYDLVGSRRRQAPLRIRFARRRARVGDHRKTRRPAAAVQRSQPVDGEPAAVVDRAVRADRHSILPVEPRSSSSWPPAPTGSTATGPASTDR